jgi:NTP pyrophosphatase (non-canonical NTP hydrolase)
MTDTNIKYQEWTRTTAIYPQKAALSYLGLGLCSEAGEVAGKLKKSIRDGGVDVLTIIDEIGDVYWYLARLVDELHFNVDVVLQRNMDKLNSRKERGKLNGSGDTR